MRARKALIIEGGGMKASYANGVLSAFEEAGYHPWDLVVGTSAGGAMGAWYSAKQAAYAEGTWKYAQDPRIINYRRWMTRKGPLLDHDALFRIVYEDEHPLNVAAVKKASWPMVVTAVDVASGETRYQDVRKGPVLDWLRATGRLPMACGDPVEIQGERLLDGGTVDPIPVRYAMETGRCNDLTLITNKPLGKKRSDPKPLVEAAARRYPALREGLVQHQDIKWQSVQAILHPPDGVTGRVISPSKPTKVSRMSRNMDHIREAIALGRSDGSIFLQQQGI